MRPRSLANLAKDDSSAVGRLKRRLKKDPSDAVTRLNKKMEKTAVSLGPVVSSAGVSGLIGAIPMAVLGALHAKGMGRGQMAHDALVGGLVGAIPGALFGGMQAYDEQKEKERALRRYMRGGGYGSEFLPTPNGPR